MHACMYFIIFLLVNVYTNRYFCIFLKQAHNVMILNFRTDRSGQTVQTQIRLLLEEQSDQDLHCLIFHLHFLEAFLCCKANLFEF